MNDVLFGFVIGSILTSLLILGFSSSAIERASIKTSLDIGDQAVSRGYAEWKYSNGNMDWQWNVEDITE